MFKLERKLKKDLEVTLNQEEMFWCDAPKFGGPSTTRQPAENLYVSYHETHI